ncbi:acyl-CoA thioesterase [Aegicerativicinus sediminis]|uniref:acyl-CoA thioesterase n=1 Tax=Aegicerativicinus sediminis TaxID=2893202 RepID=UPI001E4D89A1|nr:thioesterase family protein [Aegicerativicinus sediminis]
MFLKDFEVRWNDLDANAHLGNVSYVNFMSHTRMAWFKKYGLTLDGMIKNKLGPIIFFEHIYYFREILMDNPIKVSGELRGLSEDGMLFSFDHNFYHAETGKNLAHGEMMGGWIDPELRKLKPLPEPFLEEILNAERSKDFKQLTLKDTRRFGVHPSDLHT